MKKAKVLVPALSLLCFSAIASVTGTVAWFTTVTNASVKTSSFKIEAVEGEMRITATAGVGTKATAGSDGVYTVEPETEDTVLTHASFDSSTQKVWCVNQFDPTTYDEIGSGKTLSKADQASFLYQGKEGMYHVFSWELEFTYNFGSNKNAPALNIYFDTSSTATHSEASLADTDCAKGFRMAYINTEASGPWMVWSPFQGKTMDYGTTTGAKSAYVSGTKATTEYDPGTAEDHTDGNLHYMGETITPVSGSTGSTDRKDYLGTLRVPDTADDAGNYIGKATIRVVCWYEGLDQNVVNGSDMKSEISSTSNFYLRNAA